MESEISESGSFCALFRDFDERKTAASLPEDKINPRGSIFFFFTGIDLSVDLRIQKIKIITDVETRGRSNFIVKVEDHSQDLKFVKNFPTFFNFFRKYRSFNRIKIESG